MGKKKAPTPAPVVPQPSQAENDLSSLIKQQTESYNAGTARDTESYNNVMGGYQDFKNNLSPSKFSFNKVSADRPAELNESYDTLRGALPGYKEFAATGGYSPTDIQEIRARSVSPIRSIYGNTMMEMDRARSLGGNAGAPNYIAAASRAQRELPGQTADAMTNVNASIADAVRQGKLAGLSGMTNIGSTMGSLSSADAGRMLSAAESNQGADIQTQGMTEGSLQDSRRNSLAALSGMGSMYGAGANATGNSMDRVLNAQKILSDMQARQAVPQELAPQEKKGFWGKLGSGLAKVGKIALPIALNAFAPGSGAIAATGMSGALQKVAQTAAGRGRK